MRLKEKEEYDVLRLIEHNQVCYISSECQKGCILPRWLKYHPCVEKKEMFEMIGSIVRQLGQIHRCPNYPCYQYVNPYSMIMSEDKKLYFLDLNAKRNLEQLRIVQRRTIREHFLPPEEPYYQRASVELDIYGLGKTIQYLLSEAETDPLLTKSEEIKFQKIISQCLNRHSKKSFHNVSEIQKMIPECKKLKKNKGKVRKIVLTIMAGVILSGSVIAGKGDGESIEKVEKSTKESKQEMSVQDEILNLELGRIYFLELENYEKSKVYFENVKQSKLAESMAVISESMSGDIQEEKLRKALESAENELLLQENMNQQDKAEYYQCVLRGYSILDEKTDAENVIRIGEICLKLEILDKETEILGLTAAAYERLEKYEEAGFWYEEQLKCEEEAETKEEIYKKAVTLYEQAGQREHALELCRSGIEEFKQSSELRTIYIRILLKDSNIERSVCIQNIKEQLNDCPELEKEEEFQKLIKEHGIIVKGENVWEQGEE